MRFNELRPHPEATSSRKRVGRGTGSGLGKTCGRGHKGQKARAGGYHKVGFEGGQMPLQRRLPKVGFCSRKSLFAEKIRLSALNILEAGSVTLQHLKEAGIISPTTKQVKLYASGDVKRAYQLSGIAVTKGAREAIGAAGGSVQA